MANTLKTGRITLTGSAQQLTGIVGSFQSIRLKNPGTVNAIHLGHDNTVTASNGYPLAPGESIELDILNGHRVWINGTAADVLAYIAVAP